LIALQDHKQAFVQALKASALPYEAQDVEIGSVEPNVSLQKAQNHCQ
jgi:hypothetical protein